MFKFEKKCIKQIRKKVLEELKEITLLSLGHTLVVQGSPNSLRYIDILYSRHEDVQ